MCFFANYTLPVGLYGHIALPHLKSTLTEVWNRHYDVMDQTCVHKFRSDDQVNQWLLCAWNQAKGRFYPARSDKLGRHFNVSPDNVEEICEFIKAQSYPQVCINDSEYNMKPDYCDAELKKAFDGVLLEKSTFEK